MTTCETCPECGGAGYYHRASSHRQTDGIGEPVLGRDGFWHDDVPCESCGEHKERNDVDT